MTQRDIASIIARVLVEHPPELMSHNGTIMWVQLTWPDCTLKEAERAVSIADELVAVDCMAREV